MSTKSSNFNDITDYDEKRKENESNSENQTS